MIWGKQMDPSSLELLLLVKLNANMWDVNTIHEILLDQQQRVPTQRASSLSSSSADFLSPSSTITTPSSNSTDSFDDA